MSILLHFVRAELLRMDLLESGIFAHYAHDGTRVPLSLPSLQEAYQGDRTASGAKEFDVVDDRCRASVVDDEVDASSIRDPLDFFSLIGVRLVVDGLDPRVEGLDGLQLFVGRRRDDGLDASAETDQESTQTYSASS